MLDTATYTPRLKAAYKATVRAALKEEFATRTTCRSRVWTRSS
jgi:hypothetical protein